MLQSQCSSRIDASCRTMSVVQKSNRKMTKRSCHLKFQTQIVEEYFFPPLVFTDSSMSNCSPVWVFTRFLWNVGWISQEPHLSGGFRHMAARQASNESSPHCLHWTGSFAATVLKATAPGCISGIYGHIAAHLPKASYLQPHDKVRCTSPRDSIPSAQNLSILLISLSIFSGGKKGTKRLNLQNFHILQKMDFFSNLYLKCYHLLS